MEKLNKKMAECCVEFNKLGLQKIESTLAIDDKTFKLIIKKSKWKK